MTGKPIKLVGVGEKLDALDVFHPDRLVSRLLGMGDVVSLVEKAAETIEIDEAMRVAEKMKKGKFDLGDFLSQLRQMKKMGGLSGLMGFMPGMGKLKGMMQNANVDDSVLKRQEAIILSMTLKEREKPEVLNASRRRRIAEGSGTTVQEVNRLLKQFQDMQTMMKRMQKMGGKGMMRSMAGLFGGGNMAEFEQMAKNMQDQMGDLGGDNPLGPNPFDDNGNAPSGGNLLLRNGSKDKK